MKGDARAVDVTILGKVFSVACPNEQRESLGLAAQYLDQRMRDIQDSGRVLGMDRCAVMAALNIAHELLEERKQASVPEGIGSKIRSLQHRIDLALQEQAEMKL